MPMQTITIERKGDIRDTIEADVEGHFAVHLTAWAFDDKGEWTLTHVPTGWACVIAKNERMAKLARKRFLATNLDWSFTDPKSLTNEHKRIGSEIRRKYAAR